MYYLVVAHRPDGEQPKWVPTLPDVYRETTAMFGAGAGGFPQFAGAYGIEARLGLLLASDRGIEKVKADASLQYPMAQPGMVDYVNRRPGFAILAPSASGGVVTPPIPMPKAPSGVRVIKE